MTEQLDKNGLPGANGPGNPHMSSQSHNPAPGQGPQPDPALPPPPTSQQSHVRRLFEKLDPIITKTFSKLTRPVIHLPGPNSAASNTSATVPQPCSPPAPQAQTPDPPTPAPAPQRPPANSQKEAADPNWIPPVPPQGAPFGAQPNAKPAYEKLPAILNRTILDLEACKQVVERFVNTQELKVIEEASSKTAEPAKPPQPITQYRLATPCQTSWESMSGTDRFRLCSECKLNVYDFTAMDAPDASALVFKREAIENPSFYRRKDGRFLTVDCPVGIKRGQQTLMMIIAGVVAALLLIGLMALSLMMPHPPPPAPPPAVTESKPKEQVKAAVQPRNAILLPKTFTDRSSPETTRAVSTFYFNGSPQKGR